MDDQNQRLTEELGSKASRLKHLALDMDKDIKSQNDYLGQVGFDFDSTGALIKRGVNRIGDMMSSGQSNRKLMCYMVFGIVVGFMILYKLVSIIRT